MVNPPSRRVGWYGKLPARGDFVGRGLPARWRAEWDGWLQQGLNLAASTLDSAALRERLRSFAPWRYLALPVPGEFWCGILVPSQDRVGRAYPLTIVERCTVLQCPFAGVERLQALLDVVPAGPEALEAAIAALPPWVEDTPVEELPAPGHGWPEPPASLWWPLSAAPDLAARSAPWPPAPTLLLELLDIQPSSHRIASAE